MFLFADSFKLSAIKFSKIFKGIARKLDGAQDNARSTSAPPMPLFPSPTYVCYFHVHCNSYRIHSLNVSCYISCTPSYAKQSSTLSVALLVASKIVVIVDLQIIKIQMCYTSNVLYIKIQTHVLRFHS